MGKTAVFATVVVASATLSWAGAAGAETGQQPVPIPVAPLSPAPFLAGPSLYETGRVGRMEVSDQGSKIQRTSDQSEPTELSVQKAAAESELDRDPTTRAGTIDAAILDREIEERFAALHACRIDVARRRQIAPADVTGGQLTLRWTILPSGSAAETEVVATEPVDIQVMDCVKRQMNIWSFPRPRGGAVRVVRMFSFR